MYVLVDLNYMEIYKVRTAATAHPPVAVKRAAATASTLAAMKKNIVHAK